MSAGVEPRFAELRLMAGSPPFSQENLVTLENWQLPPFNRWAFQHVRELIPTARIARGAGPAWELPQGDELDLGRIRMATEHFGELTVDEVLAPSYTDGFLVIHRGAIVAERYFNGLRPGVPHLIMSVSKSVTGLIAGALVGQGLLDVTAPVEAIVPELAGTAFAGALVQHLLDMRAGVRFREDYDDPEAEIQDSDRVYGWRPANGHHPRAAHEYFATLSADGRHGAAFRYRSILIDVLAWVLEKAGQARFADLVSELLWQPAGAEFDADVTVDAHGNALADGGISATLRDVGRLGLLALDRGRANGRQVIATSWFDDTVRGAPDGPSAFKDGDGATGYPDGAHYRNGWWVTGPALPAFTATGIHGQSVFVHGPSQTVVVKLSSWPTALSGPLRGATLAAVTAITRELGGGE